MKWLRKASKGAASLLLGGYVLVALLLVPYYNWQYAKENGFVSWFLLGQISPSIKSVAWPYFVFFSGGTRRSPAPEMNASELERYSRVLGSLFRRDLTPADLEELRGVFRDYTTRTGRYNSPEEMRLFTAGMRVAGEYQYELARSMLLCWDQQSYFTSPKFDELAKQMKGQRKAELLALDLD